MPSHRETPSGGNASATTRKSRTALILRLLAVIPLICWTFVAFIICLPFSLVDAARSHPPTNDRTLK